MALSDGQSLILALCRIKGVSWFLVAREAQRAGGLERLERGEVIENSGEGQKSAELIRSSLGRLDDLRAEAELETKKASDAGADLFTVVDDGYPANLRLIFNLPPFLFVRGTLTDEDLFSVAVVGTRQASEVGQRRAGNMARLLVQQKVTVVSGLAKGIDTAAHTAAIEAGGRTIAVIGTGILRCYPAENRDLADAVVRHGAIVSQFWPDSPPATYTFPRRNVTMSGIAQGTVVIEASSTSGAKMQARLALDHGKKVFLIRSLTEAQPWARKYVDTRGAYLVDDVDEVVKLLADPKRIQEADARRAELAQLTLFP